MSAQPQQAPGSQEVTCVVVPLHNHTLLLPNICVAEVLPWRRTKALAGVPEWCVGVLGWRGESVVVLDYERLLDPSSAPQPHRAMLVMKKHHHREGSGFYALAAAALPRMVSLSAEDVVSQPAQPHVAVSMMTSVGTEAAMIPNFLYLEEQVRQII